MYTLAATAIGSTGHGERPGWGLSRRQGLPARGHHCRDGFALVEVVVAMSILVIALLGIFNVLNTGVVSASDERSRAIATHFAECQMEAVRNTTFASLTSVSATTAVDLQPLGPGATWERTVTAVGASSTLKSATVTIRWTYQRAPQSLSLYSLVHRDGINCIRSL